MIYLINYGKGSDGVERLQALSKLKDMERVTNCIFGTNKCTCVRVSVCTYIA